MQLIKRFNNENREDHDAMIIGHNLDPENFCLVFTSSCLLKNIIHQALTSSVRYMRLDGTYKLNILGYPLLIVGTQDLNHKFRLIRMAISKHEREKDYKFLLEGLKTSIRKIHMDTTGN